MNEETIFSEERDSKKWFYLQWGFVSLLGLVFITLIATIAVQLYFGSKARKYDLKEVENIAERNEIFDKKGSLILRLHGENREYVTLDEVSEHFLKCVVEREDSRFYSHKGVDLVGTIRAVIFNLKKRSYSQGGSTISQQLVKNTFELREKSIYRKLLEAAIAKRLELEYSKDEILEFYINKIFFGGNVYGVKRAANVYYGCDPSSLNLNQSAILAGIICAPNSYDPRKNLEGALTQRDEVLRSLFKKKRIYEDEFNVAISTTPYIQDIDIRYQENYAVDNVRIKVNNFLQALKDNTGLNYKETGGLKVYTSIDLDLQTYAEEHLKKEISSLKGQYNYPDLQGSILVLDNKTSGVLAMVGGKNFDDSKYNRTGSQRSIGSAIKPFIMCDWLDAGNRISDYVDDSPVSIKVPGGKFWKPKNFGGHYSGRTLSRNMILKSKNAMAVNMTRAVGLNRISQTVKDLDLNQEGIKFWGGLLAVQSSPLQLAGAYACLANDGKMQRPWIIDKIETKSGKIIYARPKLKQDNYYSNASTISEVKKIMSENSVSGTGRRFSDPSIFSKTGTSNDSKDCLVAAFNENITCISWILRDSNKPIAGATSSIAIPTSKLIFDYNFDEEKDIIYNPSKVEIVKPILKSEIKINKKPREKKKEDYVHIKGTTLYLPLPQ